MKREELKAMGVADELIDKIMGLHGATMTATISESKKYKEQSEQLSADLEAARKSTGDVTELRAKLEQSEKAFQSLHKGQKVRDALAEYKPKDAELLLKLIDLDKINVNDNGISGLKEQIEPIKTGKGFLFDDSPNNKGGNGGVGNPPAAGTSMNDILRRL